MPRVLCHLHLNYANRSAQIRAFEHIEYEMFALETKWHQPTLTSPNQEKTLIRTNLLADFTEIIRIETKL